MAHFTDEERAARMSAIQSAEPAMHAGMIHFELPRHPKPEPAVDHKPELAAIAHAVASIPPDDFSPITEAITKLGARIGDLQEAAPATMLLGQEVALVRKAIEKIKVGDTDLTAIVKAIEANTAAVKALVKAMSAPKHFILDEDNKPVGIELHV